MSKKQIVAIKFGNKKKRVSYNGGKAAFSKGLEYGLHNFRDVSKLPEIQREELERIVSRELDFENFTKEIQDAIKSKVYQTDSGIFHQLTKNNFYLVRGEKWIREGDPEGGKFNYESNYERYLKFFENHYSKQSFGLTLQEAREIAIERICEDKRRIPTTKIEKIKNFSSLREINDFLKKEGLERVISPKENYRPNKEVSFSEHFEGSEKSKGRQFVTEYVFGVSDELFIKNGYYEPIYDKSKSHEKIEDPRYPGKNIQYWGVKDGTINYEKFSKLGQAYVDHVNSFKERKQGTLPDGRKHVISAVWHFDEKTPHLHIEVSNLSYKEHVRKKGEIREYKLTIAANEEFSRLDPSTGRVESRGDIKPFRESCFEMLQERFFPELEREQEMTPERQNELQERNEWNKKLFETNGFEIERDYNYWKRATHMDASRAIDFAIELQHEVSKEPKLQELCDRIKQDIINKDWNGAKEDSYKQEWKSRGGSAQSYDLFLRITFYDLRMQRDAEKEISK